MSDGRNWPIYRNAWGAPRWYQRWVEAWLVLTGEWSLHRAWQSGMHHGNAMEWRRVLNGGDSHTLRAAWDEQDRQARLMRFRMTLGIPDYIVDTYLNRRLLDIIFTYGDGPAGIERAKAILQIAL